MINSISKIPNFQGNTTSVNSSLQSSSAPSYNNSNSNLPINSLNQDQFQSSSKTNQINKNQVIKWTAMGVAVAGIITGGILLAKGKFGAAKEAFEHIDFKPATDIKSAENYAKEVLGVKKVDFGGNIDIANWANEGLTNIYNKTKGKAFMPEKILSVQDAAANKAACIRNRSDLCINRNFYENIDQHIKSTIGFIKGSDGKASILPLINVGNTNELNKLLQQYNKGELKDLNSKILLDRHIQEYLNHVTYICDPSNQEKLLPKLMQDLKEKGYLIEKEGKLQFAKPSKYQEEFKNLINSNSKDNTRKLQLISQYMANIENKNLCVKIDSVSPFDNIYHEMGHLQYDHTNLSSATELYKTYKKNPEWLNNDDKQYIASLVSHYAKTDPLEFQAEVYKGLIKNTDYSEKVLKLYNELGAPIP